MAEEQKLNAALNIMRRMPPTTIENSLAGLIELVPDLTDELLTHVDQPLKTKQDPVSGKKFIVCDYNRDGDSYRSPWSNKYFPELEDGVVPSAKLREMEIEANGLLDVYRRMYFDSGESSAYYFNTEDDESQSFGACFLIHKDVEGSTSASRGMSSGVWDSIHVFEVRKSDKVAGEYVYKLTTTVLVSMEVSSDKIGKVNLSGSMTQQLETKAVVSKDRPHLVSMGKMLEDMEGRIRNQIELVYIQKTREVVGGMRLVDGSRQKEWANLTASLNAAVLDHGHSRKTDG